MRDIEFYNPRLDFQPTVIEHNITQTTPIPRYFLVWNILLTIIVILDSIHAF